MGNLVSEDVGKRREDAGGGEGKERLGAKTGPTYDEWGAGMEYRIFPQTHPRRTDGTSIFFSGKAYECEICHFTSWSFPSFERGLIREEKTLI